VRVSNAERLVDIIFSNPGKNGVREEQAQILVSPSGTASILPEGIRAAGKEADLFPAALVFV
jgi:hypothetical protein